MSDARAEVPLPPGRYFTLTWGIPDDFGGMTSALLHRSRSFVRLGGVPVEILTFDDRPDYPHLERELRERGEFVDGMTLTNLWDWVRDNELSPDAAGSLDLEKHPFTPLEDDPGYSESRRGDQLLTRTRTHDGAVLQVDHYRPDGSLALSDRRDVLERGIGGGRSIVLCDSDGAPIRSWGGAWAFYRFWLDQVRARKPSFMIVDSKPVAAFMATYRRKRAVVLHQVHGSHLSESGAKLKSTRAAVFEQLDAYDSVVLLTQRQRADVEQLLGRRDNLAVIGNGIALPPAVRSREPAVGAGIMLASLSSRKRVDHAVRAVFAAARAGHPGLSLDVYGDGDERDRIAAVVAELDAPVRLRGHVPDARELLADASFLLLTSTSEGLPLVLPEAMAVGCIPIAYDIPYGPADVIRDGVNGFLVAPGEPEAMAAAIGTLVSLSPRKLSRMRRAARKTADEFSDASIVRLWSRELRAGERRRAASWQAQQRDAG